MSADQLREEFLHPSAEFTIMPFWLWNDYLDEAELDRQMREFCAKGVDGFVIHPRQGLPPEIGYLTPTFFHYVKFAVRRAAQLGMRVFLYDEAAYPSGSCHGEVVRENPSLASHGLAMRTNADLTPTERLIASAQHDGIEYYFVMTESRGTIRGVFENEDDGQPNAPASADLLDPAAVESFIRLTHERYYAEVGEYFGTTILGIFTDEPMILGRESLPGLIAWTGDLLADYERCGGRADELYALFCAADQQVSERAWRAYRRAIYERMRDGYYASLSAWCNAHGIALLGHPDASDDIGVLSRFDIPCQDVVWRYLYPGEPTMTEGVHSTMGKCASDSARHRGKRRNGNECFGVCGRRENPYRFEREDMKWYIDWLFARGCNLLIPHAFYYSLRGARKDERPPEVGMHTNFWSEYKVLSDYAKRMCALNCDSVNQTDIAVLCSYRCLDWRSVKPLYEHQIEFNYLEEELLPECKIDNGGIRIAHQHYRVLIVPALEDEANETYLAAFARSGVQIVRDVSVDTLLAALAHTTAATIRTDRECPYLRMTRQIKYGTEYLLLFNEGEEEISTRLHLTGAAVREVWDAEEGTVRSLPAPCSDYPLTLPRRRSTVLILSR